MGECAAEAGPIGGAAGIGHATCLPRPQFGGRGATRSCIQEVNMEGYSRRDLMKLFAGSSAAIALIEAGLVTPARAARDFTWASTGGSWGEHVEDIFVKEGGFAAATKLNPVHSFQLETVAASKVVAA